MTRCVAIYAGLVLLSLAASSCEGTSKAKVSGSVTYNGKSVEDGYIVFRPADGKGVDAGGPIVNGSYTLSAVPIGPKIVVISNNTAPAENRPLTSEEASKLRTDPKRQAEVISPEAKGNSSRVEVKPGEQSFDFALRSS